METLAWAATSRMVGFFFISKRFRHYSDKWPRRAFALPAAADRVR